MMAMLNKVMQLLRRLSPLAPWRLLRTLDKVRELPALSDKFQDGLDRLVRTHWPGVVDSMADAVRHPRRTD